MCKHPPIVVSNDAYASWEELIQSIDVDIEGIVISPGPGRPERKEDMGVCLEAIAKNPNMPILGVCLGHQALGHFYNAKVELAPNGCVHGLMSQVYHAPFQSKGAGTGAGTGTGTNDEASGDMACDLFRDINQSFDVVRYHSLIVDFANNN